MSVISEEVARLLRPVPDFPIPEILFWDIAPVLREAHVMWGITDMFFNYWKDAKIDVVAGFDARGFIFGPALATRLGASFEQIRKRGKLPGKTETVSYDLEYGSAEVEMIDDGFIAGKRVLLIDDLLATGGTATAGAKLVEKLDGTVVGFACITEIPILGGRGKLMHYPVQSLISIIGDKAEWDVEYCSDVLLNMEDKWLVYVQRLSEPLGCAMPGGRIEPGESALDAALRETEEEIGSSATDIEYIATLAEPGRDPRGHKVSVVFKAHTTTRVFYGEGGKTEVLCSPFSALPPPELFAFDHGPFVHSQIAD
ncbi:MAG: hypothetical protein RLZZ480_383 [Candidatus Parcubacteria bacterium]|jgi:adenine phosphoribosyltransferase